MLPSRRAQPRVVELARQARLASWDNPTAEAVHRRRREVTLLLVFLFVSLPIVLQVVFADSRLAGLAPQVRVALQVLVSALAVALAFYVWEKERRIQKLLAVGDEERRLREAFGERLTASTPTEADGPDDLDLVATVTAETFEGQGAGVHLVRDGQLVVAGTSGGLGPRKGARTSVDRGIFGYVARTGSPYLLADELDMVEAAAQLGEDLWDAPTGAVSVMLAPVSRAGTVVGLLCVQRGDGNAFDVEDLRGLSVLAEDLGTLIAAPAPSPLELADQG